MNLYHQQLRLETIAAHEAQHNLEEALTRGELSPIEAKVLSKWSERFSSTLNDLEDVSNFGGSKLNNKKLIALMLTATKKEDLAFSIMSVILQDQFKEKTDDKHARRYTQAAHAAAIGKIVLTHMRTSLVLNGDHAADWVARLREKKNIWSPQMLRFVEETLLSDDLSKEIDELAQSDFTLVVGHYLLKVMEKNELIEIEKSGMKGTSRWYVALPSALTRDITDRTTAMIANAFMRKPMIIRPKMYTADGMGGWMTDPLTGVGRDVWRRHGHESKKNLKLPPRYATEVDRIAGTEYRIRTSILEVAKQVYNQGLLWEKGDGGFFEFDQLTLSTAMKYDESDGADNREYFENKQIREDEKKYNTRMRSLRQGIITAITIAEDYKDYEKIYFPVSCDWRGRVYFRTPGLSPQGDTFNKAVIEFATGKRLGKDGLKYLFRFAASVYTDGKVDKMEFSQQEQWARDNVDLLRAVAADPIKHLSIWQKTDSPFEFLAACEEIDAALNTTNPEDYVSHLPVRIDAVCSGIQHLSAASCDANVAPSVSLTGDTKGTDFYTLICNEAMEILNNMTQDRWSGMHDEDSVKQNYDIPKMIEALKTKGFSRKDCKPIGMQYTYAVTRRTIANRFIDNNGWRDHLLDHWKDEQDKKRLVARTGMFVADLFFLAVAQCAGRCVDVMHWYQRAAVICAQHGQGFKLTNAAGFTMNQRYLQLDDKRIESPMGQFRIKSATDTVKISKQQSGIAANATHCQDSCLVIMTSELFNGELTVIHDSMGTHACDVGELLHCVRQSMFEMYKTNPLIDIRSMNASVLGDDSSELETLELPAVGDFDIREMLTAAYLFC